MTTDLDRRSATNRRKNSPRIPRGLRMILEIPLEMKLLGANLLIVGTVLLLMFGSVQLLPARLTDVYVVIAALIVSSAVNFSLGRLALTRRSITIDEMLDCLAAGRVRMEELRAKVVYAGARKRFEGRILIPDRYGVINQDFQRNGLGIHGTGRR